MQARNVAALPRNNSACAHDGDPVCHRKWSLYFASRTMISSSFSTLALVTPTLRQYTDSTCHVFSFFHDITHTVHSWLRCQALGEVDAT